MQINRKLSKETKNKISNSNKKTYNNPEIRKKVSMDRIGEKNWLWKGNKIGYWGVHLY